MRNLILTTVLCSGVALAGCGVTKDDIGLGREAPDEFSVVTRAPLSVPPDYHLRPPSPGAQRPMEISTRDAARQTVFGASDVAQSGAGVSTVTPSGSFLDRVGATSSDPNIRNVVDAETAQGVEDSRPTAEKIMFWRSKSSEQGTPIDPKEEMKRLEDEGITTIRKRNEDIEAP